MTDQPRPINVVNIATGVCFVALGVLLLLQRAGTVELAQIVNLWPLVLVLVGGAVVWQGSRGGDASAGFGACAGWLVWVAILGLVFSHVFDRQAAAEAAADGRMNVFAVMSGAEPVATGTFTGATVTTMMGGARLNLTGVSLAPGETAVIDVLTVMGGVDVLVPADWQVDFDTTSIAGGVKDERGEETSEDESSVPSDPSAVVDEPASTGDEVRPRLIIKGVVVFGAVVVK